jgi:bifunctional non-homologous end joining protein LigD
VSLETYNRKRDFKKTPEPSGRMGPTKPPKKGRRFVVQRHRATRLHYDFRLEIDGVLMSWAVPKGPSLNPADRRMAVHVEDHPVSYFDFEGVIPKGEYGGGDVIVWDWGTFEPEETDNPGRAVASGELKFRLDGQKLRGRFTLVKTRGYDSSQDSWLLIHKKDEDADPDWDVDSLPRSVKTGRTNDEVKEGRDAVWDSQAPAESAAIDLAAAKNAPLPEFIEPMKATSADAPFDDPDWLFEVKLDGYRIEAVVDGSRVQLWTRNKQDGARYFPDLARAMPTWINAQQAIVDGEVVALDEAGNPTFSLLQDRAGMGRFGPRGQGGGAGSRKPNRDPNFVAPVVYYVFDLLYLDGQLLTDVPLDQRKHLLRTVLRDHPTVRFGAHIEGDGKAFYEVVSERGLEGMIAKLKTSRYEVGRRSKAWLKVKIRREQEVVVVGYEPGKGARADLGSLILGVYEDGELRYVGEVGSGLTQRTIKQLKTELDAHRVDTPTVVNPPRIRGAVWSEPRLVVRVEFAEWTDDGYVRQAAYKGLEIGKDPKKVVRERAIPTKAAVEEAEKQADAATAPKKRKVASGSAAASERDGQQSHAAAGGARRPRSAGSRRARKAEIERAAHDPRSGPAAEDGTQPPKAATPEELEALEAMTKDGVWSVGGQDIPLTNLDKVLFPEPGFTKRDLIRYYVTIAPVMLPYLENRPLNLWRWPDGVTGGHFWQKQIPAYAPKWIKRWDYPEAGSTESHTYLVPDSVATMAWLANHATIDMHPWTSTIDAYKNPTYALIDIDPGPKTTNEELLTLARLYRAALDHFKVVGLPKTTGKRGIQIWIPVKQIYTFRETSAWVEAISRAIGATVPRIVSWQWEKSSRQGLARLDYTQNAVNKTLVAPYAVRPVANAGVSAPLDWDELDDPDLRSDRWNIRSIIDRVRDRGDLFHPALEIEQVLPEVG